jgi:hypothetical protein
VYVVRVASSECVGCRTYYSFEKKGEEKSAGLVWLFQMEKEGKSWEEEGEI